MYFGFDEKKLPSNLLNDPIASKTNHVESLIRIANSVIGFVGLYCSKNNILLLFPRDVKINFLGKPGEFCFLKLEETS